MNVARTESPRIYDLDFAGIQSERLLVELVVNITGFPLSGEGAGMCIVNQGEGCVQAFGLPPVSNSGSVI